jgi:MFS family permease
MFRTIARNAALARFLAGEFLSSIGDWLYLVALLVLVYQTTKSPFLLALVGAARTVPAVVLSIPAGFVVDRVDRRRLLIGTDLIRAGLMVLLGSLVVIGAPIAIVVGIGLFSSIFTTLNRPAFGAYLPSLVRDETELGPANSAWSSLDSAAFIVGPAIAGLLVSAGGAALAFFLNGLSFLAVALIVLTLPSERRRANATPEEGGAPAVGGTNLRDVVNGIAGPMILDVSSSFVFGGVGVLIVILATDTLAGGAAATGYLNAAFGVGGLAGAFVAGMLFTRRPPLALFVGVVLSTFGLIGLGFASTLSVALVAIALAILGTAIVEVVAVTLLQASVPDSFRGRVFGALQSLSMAAFGLGSFVLPLLAGAVGTTLVLGGGGLFLLITGLIGIGMVGPATALPAIDPVKLHMLGLPIFGSLPPERLEPAAMALERVPVTAGQEIIRQGEPADRFYIVADGTFAVRHKADDAGRSRQIRRMGRDEVFGEIGLLTGAPRTATVTAMTDGLLYALDGPAFLDLVGTGGLRTTLLGLHAGAPGVPNG